MERMRGGNVRQKNTVGLRLCSPLGWTSYRPRASRFSSSSSCSSLVCEPAFTFALFGHDFFFFFFFFTPPCILFFFFSFLPFSYFISFSLLFPFLSKKHQPSGSFPPKGNLALAQSVFLTSLCPCACTRTPSRYVQVIKERKEEVEEEDLFLLSPLFQVQKFVRSLFFFSR